MKKKSSSLTAIMASVTLCTGILAVACILLMPAVISSPETPAGDNISGVEYYDTPENCGILITDETGGGAFFYLDFENIVTNVFLFEENAVGQAETIGYATDFTMEINRDFVLALCDRIGGIELETEDGTERYFSTSLEIFLPEKTTFDEMFKISSAFFEVFSNKGLSSSDFMFIIENTKTDINYPTCYDWIEFMPEMFCNCIYR